MVSEYHLPPNDTLTVGLVGAGRMARIHSRAWRRLGAHVVIYSPEGSEELASAHGHDAVASFDELLAAVDLIDIVSPSHTHADYARSSLLAGRDVVCEKPLALSTDDAASVVDAAARSRTLLFPAHVARFTAPNAAVKRAIDRGDIGQVAVAVFNRRTPAPASDTWFQRTDQSGGVVFDLLIHDLDQARWLCGEVESVFAVSNDLSARDAERVASVHATLVHAGGAISQITATWAAADTRYRFAFSVAGEAGTLSYDSCSRRDLEVDTRRGPAGAMDRIAPNPYLVELQSFLDSRRGAEPRIVAADGLEAVRVAEAVQFSIATGQIVTITDRS